MNVTQALNRGYNLLVCSLLGLSGLAFGTVIVNEQDLPDKIDDAVFLLGGAAAVIWYLVARNRFKRSLVPLGLTVLVLAGQILGVILEKDDKEAFGDNIGGMFLMVPFLILAIFQYWRLGRLQAEGSRSLAGQPAVEEKEPAGVA
jgi:hypothetical protein